MASRGLVIAAAAVGALLSRDALAGGAFVARGERAQVRSRTLVLAPASAGQTVCVEEIELEASASRIVYLQAFPSRPEVSAADGEQLAALRDETRPPKPHHFDVERRVFGPSILSAILGPLGEDESEAATATSALRLGFAQAQIETFEGPVVTSTKTGRRFLPDALEAWIEAERLEVPRLEREVLIEYFERGWFVVAMVFDPPGGRFAGNMTLGPLSYRFRAEAPVYPLQLGGTLGSFGELRLFTAGATALVPEERDIFWRREPWTERETPEGAVEVTYSREAPVEIALLISGLTGRSATEPTWLLRGELELDKRPSDELVLTSFAEPSLVPGRYHRGSLLDFFLCVLIGLAPLFYTPEALLALWIGYNARARRGPRQPLPFGARLWAIWAMIVALFWLFALDGIGRAAAIGPIAVALLHFLWPDERERGPYRVDFRRRKKPTKPAAPAPSKAPEAPRGRPSGSPGTPAS